MTTKAKIDVVKPSDRKIVKELEKHKRVVKIAKTTLVPETEETISIEEAEEYLWDKLKERFGTDLRSLSA